MIDPNDVIAAIELPSTNNSAWVHTFLEQVNRELTAGADARVLVDWRSNRRFLTVARGRPRP